MIQQTWAPDAEGSIAYYSEVADSHYPTTDIGVPNTEQGVCVCVMSMYVCVHVCTCIYLHRLPPLLSAILSLSLSLSLSLFLSFS